MTKCENSVCEKEAPEGGLCPQCREILDFEADYSSDWGEGY